MKIIFLTILIIFFFVKFSKNADCIASCNSNAPSVVCDLCQLCEEGFYYSDPICSECEVGFYCPGPVLEDMFMNCTDPAFYGGQSQQISPQDGFYADKKQMKEPLECTDGSYSLYSASGVKNCFPCEDGHYCKKSLIQYECKSGFPYYRTTLFNYFNMECSAGYYCNSNSTTPKGGTVLDENNENICDEGYYCPNKSVNANGAVLDLTTDIFLGRYFKPNGGPDSVRECCCGYYCKNGSTDCNGANIWGDGENECDQYYYCETGQTDSTGNGRCDDGYYCPAGSCMANQSLCDAGYYCDEGEQITCPDGLMSAIGVNINCSTCGGGTYGNDTKCEFCYPGYYCPEGATNGTGAMEGDDSSKPCFETYYCPGGSEFGNGSSTGGSCANGYYCPPGCYNDTCSICPDGHFCQNGNKSLCLPGTYQTAGVNPTCNLCNIGYYQNETGSTDCTKRCQNGYFCDLGSSSPTNEECPSGHYCLLGEKYECEEGTFNSQGEHQFCTECLPGRYQDQPAQDNCDDLCTQGYYCDGRNTGDKGETKQSSSFKNCKAGFYCGNGSTSEYGNTTVQPNSVKLCDCGFFCPQNSYTSQGLNYNGVPNTECFEGYVCDTGSYDGYGRRYDINLIEHSTFANCTSGKYCTSGLCPGEELDCLPQYYCLETSISDTGKRPWDSDVKECYDGCYCPINSKTECEQSCPDTPKLKFCEEGLTYDCDSLNASYYCRNDTYSGKDIRHKEYCQVNYECSNGNTVECPIGKISLFGTGNCTQCPKGKLCNSTDGLKIEECEIGKYCINNTEHLCGCGYYCPPGSYNEKGHNINEAVEDKECEPGYKCLNGSIDKYGRRVVDYNIKPFTNTSTNECVCGEACPQGTCNPTQCQPGTYSYSKATTCEVCLAGYFCNSTSNCLPDQYKCTLGFVCNGVTDTPVECKEGYFCPEGSYNETGAHCVNYNCSITDESLKICKEGHYCKKNSYNNKGWLLNETYDHTCDEGYFCEGGAYTPLGNDINNGTTKQCNDGWWCPEGSWEIDLNTCELGSYCLKGVKLACPKGKYSDGYHSTSCTNCTEGYCCDTEESVSATGFTILHFQHKKCYEGRYCPTGSIDCNGRQYEEDNEKLCKHGKYSTGGAIDEDCEGDCDDGYYCPPGTKMKNENDCPRGYYCVKGVGNPCGERFYCQEKSYTPMGHSKLPGKDHFHPCYEGFYCTGGAMFGDGTDIYGNTNVTRQCSDGWWCPDGSKEKDINVCELGSYCKKGVMKICPAGKYSDSHHHVDCELCEKGYYCPEIERGNVNEKGHNITYNVDRICKCGYYCPEGSVDETGRTSVSGSESFCGVGYYCNDGSVDEYGRTLYNNTIASCGSGQFCPKGTCSRDIKLCDCPEGFKCVNGSLSQCGDGVWCEVGTCKEVPCPEGSKCEDGVRTLCNEVSYQDQDGQSDCINCGNGLYSLTIGSTVPCTETCPEYYYCSGGTKDICAPGYICPAGSSSSTEELCPAYRRCVNGRNYTCNLGEWNDEGGAGHHVCQICQAGYYCPEGSITQRGAIIGENTNTRRRCEAGYYCEAGSYTSRGHRVGFEYDHECLGGYYCEETSTNEMMAACDCGYYCSNKTTTKNDQKECSEGYYCRGVSNNPQEHDCTPGFYCESKTCYNGDGNGDTDERKRCKCGHYCLGNNVNEEGDGKCDAGYYCLLGSDNKQQHECGKGNYCTEGSCGTSVCVAGTYADTETNEKCDDCPAGFYCPEGSIDSSGRTSTNSTVKKCKVGYYCTPKSIDEYGRKTINDDVKKCDEGYECPTGTKEKYQFACTVGHYCTGGIKYECPEGTYSNNVFSSSCEDCSPGFWCEKGSNTPIQHECEINHYCLHGFQKKCEEGYSSNKGASSCELSQTSIIGIFFSGTTLFLFVLFILVITVVLTIIIALTIKFKYTSAANSLDGLELEEKNKI